MRKVKVEKNPDDEIPFEVMERAIVTISESIAKMRRSRVTDKMIVALIQDDCKLGKGLIETVILSMENLEKTYLRKKP